MDSYRRYFLILIGTVTIFKIIFAGLIDISPDEAYYWNWSRHLALSYYDHPPMVAYIIYLTTFFKFFSHEIFVRGGAILMGAGTSYIVYSLARDIYKDERAGFWAALWLNIALLFSLGASIITPDTPQAFFCALFLFFF
jgi:4-amino-4-deoxy-L-arabinose transferase-like glycosyltransferase